MAVPPYPTIALDGTVERRYSSYHNIVGATFQSSISSALQALSRLGPAIQNSEWRIVLPDEVADGIHLLCSDAARAITGISIPIDGGWLSTVTYVQHPGWPPGDWDPDAA